MAEKPREKDPTSDCALVLLEAREARRNGATMHNPLHRHHRLEGLRLHHREVRQGPAACARDQEEEVCDP